MIRNDRQRTEIIFDGRSEFIQERGRLETAQERTRGGVIQIEAIDTHHQRTAIRRDLRRGLE